ncbi:DDB1- and CUL4-associated factor 5 [Nymphon striatum]|nr:DDB1- and CUL4-associated factor 5 [Nymphon striatum]
MAGKVYKRTNFVKQHEQMGYSLNSGNTKHFMRDILDSSKNLYQKDLFAHYGCVNAVEFSPNGDFLASGGDDRRLLLWKIQSALDSNPSPVVMKGEHGSNIFCIAFDNSQSKIFSAGNDENIILHDLTLGTTKDIFLHTHAVYSISVDPMNDNVFASAGDNGSVLIWDIRVPPSEDPFCLAKHKAAFYSVMYNPVEPRLIATANNKQGVALWDIRKPRKCCLLKYGGPHSNQSAMSIRFNSNGTKILALRRRLPPILYDIHSSQATHEFDSPGYYNSCTMKSCCFAGYNDEYVLSGSDDFKLYVWKVPTETCTGIEPVNNAHMILKGHRSIVNQVRFNPSNFLIASSGVEKIVKLWSVFPVPDSVGTLDEEMKILNSRKFYSPEDYVNIVLTSGTFNTHDYSHHSVHEDSRMMAFFDSLVQRDIEGWTSDTTGSSQDEINWEIATSGSSSSSSSSSNSCDDSSSENIFDSEVEHQMEISDILTRRIAARRKDLKHSTRLSYIRKKLKNRRLLKKKKSKKIPISSSSSSDEASLRNEDEAESSNRGFFTIDSILGPPVWQRFSNDSNQIVQVNDNRRNLQKLRARILRNLFDDDSDSDDDDSNVTNSVTNIRESNCDSIDSSENHNLGLADHNSVDNQDHSELRGEQENNLESETVKKNESTSNRSVNENINSAKTFSSSDISENSTLNVNSEENACNGSSASTVNNNTAETCENFTPANSSLNTESFAGPSSSSQNGNVTWAEFKRFKNKVQRASRQYRKHRSSGMDDSD